MSDIGAPYQTINSEKEKNAMETGNCHLIGWPTILSFVGLFGLTVKMVAIFQLAYGQVSLQSTSLAKKEDRC